MVPCYASRLPSPHHPSPRYLVTADYRPRGDNLCWLMAGVKLSPAQLKQWTDRNPHLQLEGMPPTPKEPIVLPHAPADTIVFDIAPMGAPRMVRSDKFNKREVVVRYHAFKDFIRARSASAGYTLGGVFRARFEIALPASWSKKKKEAMRGQPHQQKPDCDNIIKGICDAYNEDDSHVHTMIASKVWADTGRIIIYP